MKSVVIVGASHAAVETISKLRKENWDGKIVLIGDEANLPYQRPPLSKNYLQSNLNSQKIELKPEKFYQNVDLHLGVRATSINRKLKNLSLSNGTEVAYDKLVIATGTRARQLNIDGSKSPTLQYLRSIEDADKLRKNLVEGSTLLIVGGGYIGLEVAASAIKMGIKVTVLEAMNRVLERVTSPIISEFYQQLHTSAGVDVRLNDSVKSFTKAPELASNANSLKAILDSGVSIQADCVVVGIGVIPNMELAVEAGLECENGIVVNQHAQTSDPDIYAIGDCSNHLSPLYQRRVRLESVPNAIEQAKTAAASICGTNTVYNSVPWFWSDQYDIKLQTAGLSEGYDETVIRGDHSTEKFSAAYLKKGKLIALDAINSPADFIIAKKLIQSQLPVDTNKLADASIPLTSLL